MEALVRRLEAALHRRGRKTESPPPEGVSRLQVQASEEGQVRLHHLLSNLLSFFLSFCIKSHVQKHLQGHDHDGCPEDRSDHEQRHETPEDQALAGVDDHERRRHMQIGDDNAPTPTPTPATTTTTTSDCNSESPDCSGYSCTLENSALD